MIEYLPARMVFDFGFMYEYFQKKGLQSRPEDMERRERILGHAPRIYYDFVKETAMMWKSG